MLANLVLLVTDLLAQQLPPLPKLSFDNIFVLKKEKNKVFFRACLRAPLLTAETRLADALHCADGDKWVNVQAVWPRKKNKTELDILSVTRISEQMGPYPAFWVLL